MKTEDFTQATAAEELRFDAHEFDGLREDFTRNKDAWLTQADRFVRSNPWLCIALAAAVGCGVAYRWSSRDASQVDTEET